MSALGIGVAAQPLAPTKRPPPSAEQIRAALEHILTSPDFAVPARASAFLRYVVEETLAGRASRIKGYTIATEVFHRDEGFTQDDPVVRIEAGRIRRALERYFLLSGQSDQIRIEIPLGAYVPKFFWHESIGQEPIPVSAPEPVAESPKAIWISWRGAHWLLTGALAFLAVLMAFAYWNASLQVRTASLPSAEAGNPNGPTLVVAPFADLGEGTNARDYAIGLTEELLTLLPQFKELTVFGRETTEALPAQVAVSHVREQLGARYLLSGGVQVSGTRIPVTARLSETENGSILWSKTYDNDLRSRDIFAIQSDVAAQVATAVAQPYGIIYEADAASAPPDDLAAYHCTLQFYVYHAQLSAEQHAIARDCLERAVASFPTYATAWSMLSIAYLDEDRFGFNRRAGLPPPLERSLTAARRAVELDSHNIRALQALMNALFFNQQLAESIEVGEKALAINPNDTEFLGEFGARLALGGQWKRGATLLQEALARNPAASGYFHGTLAFSAFMLDDNAKALAEIRQANLNALPIFHLIAALVYAQNGLADDAAREGDAFNKMRPEFLPNLDAELMKRNIQPEDRLRIVAGLRKAGLLPLQDATSGISGSGP